VANAALRRAGRNGLSAGDTKFPAAYDQASRDYLKHKKLMEHRDKNPSLGLFIQQLDALRSRLIANHPAASQGNGNTAPEGEKPQGNMASDQPE
jgi:hypothetical protein